MGSNTSKQCSDVAVMKKKEIGIDANSDPRSPTPEIARTPLQGKTGTKHNITKNADLRKTFENGRNDEKLIHNNPILSAVIKNHLQSYDPRSPTQEFERTPIIIVSENDGLTNGKGLRSQTENYGSPSLKNDDTEGNYDSCAEAQESPDFMMPKNLCNGFYDMTLNGTINENEESLDSSAVSNDGMVYNNTSKENLSEPTKFLETDFDYVEEENKEFEDSRESIQRSDHDQTDNDLKYIPHFKILNEDPRSPSTGIERTPIVVEVDKTVKTENVEDMSDDSLIKVLQNTNSELRGSVNKPEGVLIYEDETSILSDTPKKSKSGTSSGSRTPLSCMKNKGDNAHTRSKSANMLPDPKSNAGLPSKVPRRASHIPRLKSLTKPQKIIQAGSSVSLKNISKTSVVGGDCENTPPHSHRDRWDKDNSIVL